MKYLGKYSVSINITYACIAKAFVIMCLIYTKLNYFNFDTDLFEFKTLYLFTV